jgi:hypothetical protein
MRDLILFENEERCSKIVMDRINQRWCFGLVL